MDKKRNKKKAQHSKKEKAKPKRRRKPNEGRDERSETAPRRRSDEESDHLRPKFRGGMRSLGITVSLQD